MGKKTRKAKNQEKQFKQYISKEYFPTICSLRQGKKIVAPSYSIEYTSRIVKEKKRKKKYQMPKKEKSVPVVS